MRERYRFLPKDFVETPEGLLFAVVAEGVEQGRVLGHLRYRRSEAGLSKVPTEQSRQLLAREFRQYVFHSPSRDVELPGIPLDRIQTHYLPSCQLRGAPSQTVKQAAEIFESLGTDIGLTGSHLIGADSRASDIDLVVYGLEQFDIAGRIAQSAISHGKAQQLSERQWQTTYAHRGDMALDYSDYLWHEKRKNNKFSLNGTKVDLSCVADPHPSSIAVGRKIGFRCIKSQITGDSHGFGWPAVFEIDHATIGVIVVYSATYIGQAKLGERVQAAGMVERTADGQERLIVGSSRECPDEYLRVIR